VLQCVAVCCSVLQCVAVCCSVLQCVAVCCSVLQCVAVCCSVYCHIWSYDVFLHCHILHISSRVVRHLCASRDFFPLPNTTLLHLRRLLPRDCMHTAYLQILHLWASRDFFPLPNTTLSAPLAPERYCISLAESLLEICSATQRAKYSARDMQYLSSLLETLLEICSTLAESLTVKREGFTVWFGSGYLYLAMNAQKCCRREFFSLTLLEICPPR